MPPAARPARAYALLTAKSVQEEQRLVSGVATTPRPDRVDDVIEPLGVRARTLLPFLLDHKTDQPVGELMLEPPTAEGIRFRVQIPKVTEPGVFKDRTDLAWHTVKYLGRVMGASIGFRPLAPPEPIKGSRGYRYPSVEVVEVSLVAVPANADATIDLVKSLATASLAASGSGVPVSVSLPGASGFRTASMTISEQLTAEKADLQTKSARLEVLLHQEDTDGTLDEAEAAERDALTSGVQALTKKIERLSTLEAAQAVQASPLTVTAPSRLTAKTLGRIEVVKPDLPKGTLFTRYAMAVAAGKGSLSDTLAYARRWDAQTPEVSAYIKAVEGTSVVASPGWGGELVYQTNLASEFVELLRAATILGRIDGFRRTPFNVRIPVQSGGSTVAWVGEAAPKPVTELAFSTITLGYHKVAGIVVLTEELVRLSSPSAEETVRRDLTEQIARFLDVAFIDSSVGAGANSPAAITNGASATVATGVDVTSLLADVNSALAAFDTANVTTENLVVVTTPAIARGISTLLSPLGQPAFPGMTPSGGTFLGYPVIVSASVPAGFVNFLKPSEILLADDGRVTLDASNQATLDMDGGSPSTPTFNLWQRNCIGIRAERWITWRTRHATAASLISGAAYGPAAGSP